MKTVERERARDIRLREGKSIKEIARMLDVSVSSVSVWVRDIDLTQSQHDMLRERNPAYNRLLNGSAIAAANRRRERLAAQAEGRRLARERDGWYAAGCMLLWAEGDKRRNAVALANSDPHLLVFFALFLRKQFGVCDDDFRIYCNLFADHVERQREIEQFWLSTLELPSTCLRKSTINRYSKYSAKKRSNKLPYGTCKLVVHSTKIVQTIFGSIQEYGGFERPEWLD